MARGIDPEKWGPSAWTLLHYVTLGYPDDPDSEDIQRYASFFESLVHVLPCLKCRESLKHHYTILPPDEALWRGKQSLFEWGISLHRMVSASLGKAETRTDWKSYYSSGGLHVTSKSCRIMYMIFGAVILLLVLIACSLASGRFCG